MADDRAAMALTSNRTLRRGVIETETFVDADDARAAGLNDIDLALATQPIGENKTATRRAA